MKKTIPVLIFILFNFSISAQVEFTSEISKDAVMINEPFKVEYKINKNFDDFNLKGNENFEVISGPSTSFQQSINMTNGKTEKTISVTYTYFLKAKTAGKQTVPKAGIKIHGKYYYSDAKDIIVIDAEYHNSKENDIKDIEGTSKL